MPKHAVVTLRYGPYSAVGLSVEHRTYRLEGLQAVLAKDGHEIILEQIEDWNLVELVVNEEIVFQCDIQDLEFGPYGKDGCPNVAEEPWGDFQAASCLCCVYGFEVACFMLPVYLGGDGKLDPLCEEARIAVLDAF